MKKFFFITFILALSLNSNSQWLQINSPSKSSMNSLVYTDSKTGYAFGGEIIKTVDAGATWSKLTSGTTKVLIRAFFANPQTGYVVGITGTMLKTIDAGNTWTALSTGTTNDLSSIYFIDANTGYVGGVGGTILKTSDGGITWNALSTGVTDELSSIYFTDAQTGYAIGSHIKTLIKTTDAGKTWVKFPNIGHKGKWLGSLVFTDTQTGFACGDSGSIVKTIDAGNTWFACPTGTLTPICSIYFTTHEIGWAADYVGLILKTTDAGNSWQPVSSGTTKTLYSVKFTDINTGYIVGSSGIILKTTNNGGDSIATNFPLIKEKAIEIFPCPAKDFIYLSNLSINSYIEMFDVKGNLIKVSANIDNRVSVDKLISGMYFIKIKNNDGYYLGRFIKE